MNREYAFWKSLIYWTHLNAPNDVVKAFDESRTRADAHGTEQSRTSGDATAELSASPPAASKLCSKATAGRWRRIKTNMKEE